jgi:hypothetical protein
MRPRLRQNSESSGLFLMQSHNHSADAIGFLEDSLSCCWWYWDLNLGSHIC